MKTLRYRHAPYNHWEFYSECLSADKLALGFSRGLSAPSVKPTSINSLNFFFHRILCILIRFKIGNYGVIFKLIFYQSIFGFILKYFCGLVKRQRYWAPIKYILPVVHYKKVAQVTKISILLTLSNQNTIMSNKQVTI